MPDASGTIEKIAVELGNALEPLTEVLDTGFFDRLGAVLPEAIKNNGTIQNKFTAAANAIKNLKPELASLATAITGENTSGIISSSIKVVANIAELSLRFKEAGDLIDTAAAALPPADKTLVKDLAKEMSARVMEYVAVGYLDTKFPNLIPVLNITGIIDKEHEIPEIMEITNAPRQIIPRRFYLDRIPKLITDPVGYLDEIYKWKGSAANFESDFLLNKVLLLLESLAIPAEIFDDAQKQVLEAYFFNLEIPKTGAKPELKFNFSLPGNLSDAAKFERTIDFSELWKAKVSVAAKFDAGLEVTVKPPFDITAKPPSGNLAIDALLSLIAEKSNGDPIDLLSFAGGSRLNVKKIEGGIGLHANFGTSGGALSPALMFDLKEGKLILDFSQGDGFIQKILSGFKAEADFTIGADWNPKDGIRFRGDAGLEILVPLHIDLSVIIIDGIYLKIKVSNDIPIQLGLATKFTANLGPLKAVVEKIGININFTFPKGAKGNLGLADVGFGFQPPSGVGLSLDVGVVKGGGYLYFDFDKEEYAGVLELSIAQIITVKAIGLITTKMPDGSKGFSLLLIITAEFGTPIQLGFGFTLIGVGGLVGLNRTMLPEAIAAGIKSGGINSIMFPANPVQNAPKIISDLRTYFPPYEGKFLIGPMLKMGWGTPTLISLSFGLIIEIPGNIAIIGVLHIGLPADELAVVVINVGFIGALEFDKKRIWFYASIFDSRILFLTLEGDMGLLMDFGDNPNFVLSVGGFHPMFSPPPLPFPNPKRIRIDVLRTALQRISVESYFAVTSNTVQFGARAELFIGLAVVEVTGHFAFDALFQFSPFKFIIQISFSVSLKVFGVGLFSIRLEMSLEGPTPWHAKGTGTLSIDLWLFEINISASFDITWGDAQNTSLPSINVIPLLVTEFEKVENWRAKLPASKQLLVSLRQSDSDTSSLVLHPLGTLQISQRAVPLHLNIDKVGNNKADDGKSFSVKVATAGLGATGITPQEKFAVAQYQNLTNDQKLTAPAFQDFDGGIELSVTGRQLGSSKAVRRTVRYETIIIDSNFKRFVIRFFAPIGTLFSHWISGGAVSKSKLSQSYKKSMVPFGPGDRIKVEQPGYVVADVANNKAVDGLAYFANEALARDYMNSLVSKDPNKSSEVHVISSFESVMS